MELADVSVVDRIEFCGRYRRTRGTPRLVPGRPAEVPQADEDLWMRAEVGQRAPLLMRACASIWTAGGERSWDRRATLDELRLHYPFLPSDPFGWAVTTFGGVARAVGARQVGRVSWDHADVVGDVAMTFVQHGGPLTQAHVRTVSEAKPWMLGLSPSGLSSREVSWAGLLREVVLELREGGAEGSLVAETEAFQRRDQEQWDRRDKARRHERLHRQFLQGRPEAVEEDTVAALLRILFVEGVHCQRLTRNGDVEVFGWQPLGTERACVEVKPLATAFAKDATKSPADFDALVCARDDRAEGEPHDRYPACVISLEDYIRDNVDRLHRCLTGRRSVN